MKMTFEMPFIQECSMSNCAYNHDESCHARAVTIGDGVHPGCDTFFSCGSHCKSKNSAGVGACKVSACMHNADFECQAGQVIIGMDKKGACCTTFASA